MNKKEKWKGKTGGVPTEGPQTPKILVPCFLLQGDMLGISFLLNFPKFRRLLLLFISLFQYHYQLHRKIPLIFLCFFYRLNWNVGLACLLMYAGFLIFASLLELNIFFPVNLPTCVSWHLIRHTGWFKEVWHCI